MFNTTSDWHHEALGGSGAVPQYIRTDSLPEKSGWIDEACGGIKGASREMKRVVIITSERDRERGQRGVISGLDERTERKGVLNEPTAREGLLTWRGVSFAVWLLDICVQRHSYIERNVIY